MSNYDYLKPILGDDLFGQFAEKMNGAEGVNLANIADGNYIPKAKFDEQRNTSKNYKTQIEQLNSKLTALQEAANGNEALKGQIAQLQQDIASRDAAMKQRQLEFAIKNAVRDSKARNADVVAKMIDASKITQNNGSIYGLDQQIKALKQSDAYLFEEEYGSNGGVDPHQNPDGGKPTLNATLNDLIRKAAGR